MEIFDFTDYKAYLNYRLDDRQMGGGRGSRAKLSRFVGCQTAYTAQVLRASAHFSLEQAESINEFLDHSRDEGSFFLLLVQFARAGTARLRQRFAQDIKATTRSRLALKNRVAVSEELGERDQATYYSAWYYAAIHALVSLEGYQLPGQIAARLGISVERAQSALIFLLHTRLLVKDGERLKVGVARIHLPHDSPLVAKHHINWRLEAIRALEQDQLENLHYSSAITISKKDSVKIREQLVKTIAQIKSTVRDSKEEELHALSLDFFEVRPIRLNNN